MRNRTLRFIPALVLMVILVLAGTVMLYAGDYYHADEEAALAWESGELVTVTKSEEGRAVFIPENPAAGLIFYPGGKVEYSAYAPLMQEFAERGVLCVLVEMPLNLAVLDVNAADGIIEQFPEIEDWYIGGHSLGGSMAASYAAEHADELKGLILLAAYSTADLTGSGLKVASVYGSNDKVLNMEKYEKYRGNLPEGTAEKIIEGGNHAGFGSYGAQEGDGEATISSSEQIEATVEFFVNNK